jgi:autotransporter-associated beta strand protein
MKTIRVIIAILFAILWSPQLTHADLAGPYAPDTNTLFLFHFDEAAGGTVTTNVGSKARNAYSVNMSSASATPATVTTMFGAAGYVNGATNFGNCMTNPTTGYMVGFDFNNSGTYQGDAGTSATLSPDQLGMTNLNIGNGGQTPFTLEALIQPTTTAGNQEILCTDNSAASITNRGFQFRISSGVLQLQFIGGPSTTAVSGTIPTTGPHAFVAGQWYHVACTYDGTTARLYWTLLNPSIGAAQQINSAAATFGATHGAIQGPLVIGNENKGASAERFIGSIDEVRISSVARAANQMQFFSPLVTITQNPVSQNVDYNQPVSFSVGASSLTMLSYQWRFNSNSIAGGTNASYSIPAVAANNAGYYDVVVTNTAGYAATSSSALLVVGAANFLGHRYSFTVDGSDSVGTAHGTLQGSATVAGGQLVLDGNSGTYLNLPANLFSGATASALTVEFWATFGVNNNGARVFSFGNTISGTERNYLMFMPHSSVGHALVTSGGDVLFQQQVTNAGTMDNQTLHIACVMDPPNNTLSIYTNGVLDAANTNLTVGIASLNDALSYIGRSLNSGDPYLNASIDELRIYNGAVGGLTLQQSHDLGPEIPPTDGPVAFLTQPASQSVPVGWNTSFTALAGGYVPIKYQWFKNGSPIGGATNSSYSFTAALADDAASFSCRATNTIGATTYDAATTNATLTVVTPAQLAWLDFANGGAGDNQWNTTSLNWTNTAGGGPLAFTQTSGVLFDNRGTGSPTVDLSQQITPYNLTHNEATDYTLTSFGLGGSLSGQGSINKLNSGALIIDVSNQLSGPVTISGGTLQVGNASANGSLGTATVTNNATLAFNRSDAALIVNNAIHGSGTVRFDGTGTTTIGGNNDYAGSTLVNAGIVSLQSASGLGSSSTGTTVANGGQLYVTANIGVPEGLTLNGAGDGNGALRKNSGAASLTGPVSLATDTTISVNSGGTLTLNNVVSGTGVLSATGSGTLVLAGTNTYNNGTTVSGPVIQVNNARALAAGAVTFTGNGRLEIADGLTVSNTVVANVVSPGAIRGLVMVADNTNGTVTTFSGPVTFNASPATGGGFYGPTSSGYLNVTGPLTNTVTGLVNARGGNIRFSGGGDYSTLTMHVGVVSLGANHGICSNATMTVALAATEGPSAFDLNGFSQSLVGLTTPNPNLATVTNSAGGSSTLTLNLTADSNFDGRIAGNVAVTKTGPAILTLGGTNAYSGNTTVDAGTLAIAQPTLATSSTVSVTNGAELQLNFAGGETNQVAALVLNGASQPPGVYNSTTSSPLIAGTGNLLVASAVASYPTNITVSGGGGTLTLSWPSTHLGWLLQSQTNSHSVGLSTNWFDVAGSASMTSTNISVNPGSPTVFYRLRKP